MTALLALIALGTPTHGVTASQEVATAEHADSIDATITLSLATDSKTWVETELPVTLPPGAQVYALAIETSWQTFVSRSEPVDDARAHFAAVHNLPYDSLTGRPRDPALLEQTDRGLVLHVFPVAREHPTVVRIYASWPRDGEPVRRDWMSEDPTPRHPLDAQTALYAGPIIQLPVPGEQHEPHRHVALVPDVEFERLQRRRVAFSASCTSSCLE